MLRLRLHYYSWMCFITDHGAERHVSGLRGHFGGVLSAPRRLLLAEKAFHLFVDCIELPLPRVVVQEGAMIEPVIVGTISLRVTGRRQDRHFVAIYGVTPVEVFHLIRHFFRGAFIPHVDKSAEHGEGASTVLLP